METCKAIIQEGTRKGEKCKFPPGELNAYCGRHQRNYEYDTLIEEGKRPCRFFFRGCNSLLEHNTSSCEACRTKLSKKTTPCGHEGCSFKTEGSKYCKKHQRDVYRDEEKEKGIRYCDIARGCFTLLTGETSKCEECLSTANTQEKKRLKTRQTLHNALNTVEHTSQQICVGCGKDFEKYMTRYNRPSKLCKPCNETQKKQDDKRSDRIRNFKQENYNNLPRFYKEYIQSAFKRGYSIEIQFDDFKELVLKPCYYCKSLKENEVNGIDRVDNSNGYTKENCVPCCSTCNRMKLIYHPSFFITKCKIISKIITVPENFFTEWKEHFGRCRKVSFTAYKNSSLKKRNIPVNLTEDEWNSLIFQPCHYCGYTQSNGIGLDRLDNSIREYSMANVKPCCGSCNYMKGEMSYQDFLDKTKQIAEAWSDTICFDVIAKPKDAFKEASRKVASNAPDAETRKTWKALGVYYSLLTESTDFYDSQKEILIEAELQPILELVKHNPKEHCIPVIQTFLVKLKKRRQRKT